MKKNFITIQRFKISTSPTLPRNYKNESSITSLVPARFSSISSKIDLFIFSLNKINSQRCIHNIKNSKVISATNENLELYNVAIKSTPAVTFKRKNHEIHSNVLTFACMGNSKFPNVITRNISTSSTIVKSYNVSKYLYRINFKNIHLSSSNQPISDTNYKSSKNTPNQHENSFNSQNPAPIYPINRQSSSPLTFIPTQKVDCSPLKKGPAILPPNKEETIPFPTLNLTSSPPITPKATLPLTPKAAPPPLTPKAALPLTPKAALPLTPKAALPLTPKAPLPTSKPISLHPVPNVIPPISKVTPQSPQMLTLLPTTKVTPPSTAFNNVHPPTIIKASTLPPFNRETPLIIPSYKEPTTQNEVPPPTLQKIFARSPYIKKMSKLFKDPRDYSHRSYKKFDLPTRNKSFDSSSRHFNPDNFRKYMAYDNTHPNSTPQNTNTGVYYAVAVGRNVGIFYNWEECNDSIKGYSSARFRKFGSRKEAEEFILTHSISVPNEYEHPDDSVTPIDTVVSPKTLDDVNNHITGVDKNDVEICYADGSFHSPGQQGQNSSVAFGVYYSNLTKKVCQKLSGDMSRDSCRCELYACIAAIENYDGPRKNLSIYTDSAYVVNIFNTLTCQGLSAISSRAVNTDLIEKFSYSLKECPAKVCIIHISKKDKHPGNVEAHNLAYSAAMSYATVLPPTSKKK